MRSTGALQLEALASLARSAPRLNLTTILPNGAKGPTLGRLERQLVDAVPRVAFLRPLSL